MATANVATDEAKEVLSQEDENKKLKREANKALAIELGKIALATTGAVAGAYVCDKLLTGVTAKCGIDITGNSFGSYAYKGGILLISGAVGSMVYNDCMGSLNAITSVGNVLSNAWSNTTDTSIEDAKKKVMAEVEEMRVKNVFNEVEEEEKNGEGKDA